MFLNVFSHLLFQTFYTIHIHTFCRHRKICGSTTKIQSLHVYLVNILDEIKFKNVLLFCTNCNHCIYSSYFQIISLVMKYKKIVSIPIRTHKYLYRYLISRYASGFYDNLHKQLIKHL